MKYFEAVEDMLWLSQVHNAPKGYACAILYGNEDSPTKIELFARNDYKCLPTVLTPDDIGEMVIAKYGESPKQA